MNPVTIRKEIKIAAPATQVWRYIGTAAGLRQWWGIDVILEERAGGYCEEQGLQNGRPYRLVGEVTVYEPPHRLVMALHRQDGHGDCPAHTELEITLAEEAAHTSVAIVHRAFAALAAISAASEIEEAWHGPLMALPGYDLVTRPLPGQLNAFPLPIAVGVTAAEWQQAQEEQWQSRSIALCRLITTIIQQEAFAS